MKSVTCRYYIGYKILKKRIKQYAIRAATASDDERDEIIHAFSRLLDSQVHPVGHKFANFI
jgi:hypothetical protein